MKKILLSIFGFIWYISSTYTTLASGGILQGVSTEDIRRGNIGLEDIPKIIQWAIDYIMGFAASVAIIFIIIWSYKIAFGAVEWDKSKGKKTIALALGGLTLASLSWLILKTIVDNFL